MDNNLGFDEILGTVSDAIRAELQVQKSLEDKTYSVIEIFQDALSTYPKVMEAIRDFPTFKAQINDLTVAESVLLKMEVEKSFTPQQISDSYIAGLVVFGKDGYIYLDSVLGGSRVVVDSFKKNVLKQKD